jgi:hypothetical protein
MSHIKTFKITATCFDHQMIIIRELSDPGKNYWLKCESSSVFMRQHTFIRFACCIVQRGMSTCFNTNKCIRWTIILVYSELKCTAKQWKTKTIFDSSNHTRFPKENHLPDCASRDNQVKKGGPVELEECDGSERSVRVIYALFTFL